MTGIHSLNITVIGGTRGLGYWVAKTLSSEGFNVTITSRNESEGQKVADRIRVTYCNDNIESMIGADVIILSVPIEHMVDTIKNVVPFAPENSLLMDVTSIKEQPANALKESAPKNTSILPCHPMFGPRTPSWDGQVVILTPFEKDEWFFKIKKFLEERNVTVIISTPHEHDKMMSVVQGLTHFSYISIASTIKKIGVKVKKTREFASPIYSLMIDMISRIVSQNPNLYYSIQKYNEETRIARNLLIDESITLSKMIEENDEEGFTKKMSESASFLNEFEEALGRSDKAINFLTEDLNFLKNSIGSEVGLLHQYSKKVHVGIVKSVSANEIVLNDINNKEVKLKLSNVNILTPDELYEWKKDNLKKYSYDISVIFPDSCNPEILLKVLTDIDEVISARITEIYNGSQIADKHSSIKFSYEVFNKEDRIIVEKFLKGIGGTIR